MIYKFLPEGISNRKDYIWIIYKFLSERIKNRKN